MVMNIIFINLDVFVPLFVKPQPLRLVAGKMQFSMNYNNFLFFCFVVAIFL